MVLEFDASPVTWRTHPARVVQIVMTSPQLDRQMEAVAEDMRQTAEDVYISQEKASGELDPEQVFTEAERELIDSYRPAVYSMSVGTYAPPTAVALNWFQTGG